jgi:tetratricopeptide (TPR) repeat protein
LAVILTGQPPYVGETFESVRVQAARGRLEDCFARLDASGAAPELVALCKKCLTFEPEDRPADAGEVARAVADLRQAAEERAREAELERVRAEGERQATELRVTEQRKRRRVQRALAVAVGLLLVAGLAFGWWQSEQRRGARERQARNGEAVAALLDQCEQALRAGDAAAAGVTLEAAQKRAEEGGAESHLERLERCQDDLALLRDLDAVDQFRWTQVEGERPDPKVVAERYREALGRFQADPGAVGAEFVAARVSRSAVRERLVVALDRLLQEQRSAAAQAALRAIDPDPYRDAVRDAVRRSDGAALAKLAGQPEALEQPPGFAAFLGQNDAIKPLERRRALLQAALRRRAGDLGLLMAMGGSYDSAPGLDEALRWSQAAVAAAPANPAAHHALGYRLHHKGDLDNAIAEYREAIRLDPKYSRSYNQLGNALLDKRDPDGAIAAFQAVLRLGAFLPEAHTNLGAALDAKGDLDGAIAEYRKALPLYSKGGDALTHNNLGFVLQRKGDLDGAMAEYQEALRLEPKFSLAHINIGWLLHDRGDLDGAIAKYREAIRLDPSWFGGHQRLGIALRDKGNLDGAFAEYREAVRLRPWDHKSRSELAKALYASGKLDEAIAEYREGLRLDPKCTSCRNELGRVLNFKEDLDAAIPELREAVRLDPKNPWFRNDLGNALKDNGDLEGAIAQYQEALRIDPKHPYASTNLRHAERARELLPHLPDVLAGKRKPKDAAESYDFGRLCYASPQKRYADAVRLFAQAFAADPTVAEDLGSHNRYVAASAAALGGCGKGKDAASQNDQARARLRGQALSWLRADLALRRQQANSGQAALRKEAAFQLAWWLEDSDLVGVRPGPHKVAMPAEERAAWDKLWADVRATLALARQAVSATPAK